MKYDEDGAPPPTDERPRCPSCDAPLKPVILMERTWTASPELRHSKPIEHIQSRRWNGSYYTRGGYFCSLRCAARYGREAYEREVTEAAS